MAATVEPLVYLHTAYLKMHSDAESDKESLKAAAVTSTRIIHAREWPLLQTST